MNLSREFLASHLPVDRTELSQIHRLPDAADLRRMCIITKSDLNRIHDNIDRRQRDREVVEQELERKRALAARSAEVTKHWPNTILVRVFFLSREGRSREDFRERERRN